MRRVVPFLHGLTFGFVVVFLLSLSYLRLNGHLAWVETAVETDSVLTVFDEGDLTLFHAFFPEGDTRTLLGAVMNLVSKKGTRHPQSPASLLQHAQGGGAVACGGMSTLYAHALMANGETARIVQVSRNSLLAAGRDTHVTVEVLTESGWIVVDPTFGVSFKRGDQFLESKEIQDALLAGGLSEIEVVVLGDFAYSNPVSDYYLDLRLLFNNVYYRTHAHRTGAWKIVDTLPLANLLVGQPTYLGSTRNEDAGNQRLFLLFSLQLPLAGLALIGLSVAAEARRRRDRRSV